jgi:SulP family sulfate permease
VRLVRYAPRNDVIVLVITFLLTVLTDLVVAVNVGVLLAALLFMRRMAQSVQVEQLGPDQLLEAINRAELPKGIAVYSIDGPFFFGAAETFERVAGQIHADIHTLVLRMKRVPFVDATAILTLQEMVRRFHKRGTRVLLCETNALVAEKLQRAGLLEELGSRDARQSLTACLAAAEGVSLLPAA